MENDTNVLDSGLPFTNYTTSDFVAKWDGKEYTFPALSTVKMLGMIGDATIDQLKNIRAKFAMDLAVAVFYQSEKFKAMDLSVEDSQAGKTPALYTDKDIAPFVQRCLEPLPVKTAKITAVPKADIALRTDETGAPVSKVLDGRPGSRDSLVNGQVVA